VSFEVPDANSRTTTYVDRHGGLASVVVRGGWLQHEQGMHAEWAKYT